MALSLRKEPESLVKPIVFPLGLLGKKRKTDTQFDLKKLPEVSRGKIFLKEPMARHTTLKVGGPADAFVRPEDLEDLSRLLAYAEAEKIPVTILGGGSNLLVRDGGIRGLVISLREFNAVKMCAQPEEEVLREANEAFAGKRFNEKSVYVDVQAGVSTPKLVRQMGHQGLTGLEGLVGVLGLVGGALAMNAGTRHGQIGDVLVSLRAINRSGQIRSFLRNELAMEYRFSGLDRSWYILDAVLGLQPGDAEAIRKKMKELFDYRQKTQPLSFPNCGSVFKNPKSGSAGELIERLGLKGVRLRGAKISEMHGNWIVNHGGATAQDILQLIELIQEKAKEIENIELETEIRIVGEKAGS